ncbi:glycoside hydrolase family 5 protein [Suillus spraguei]|nr:glycoside hydrolase family 5 protein [Suillus spraguei]
MVIKFLYSFVAAALSTTTLLVNARAAGRLKFAGVNIAGFDFSCGTDGTCVASGAVPPVHELSGIDGVGQMQHFSKDDGYNLFRLPVGWQYLTNDQMTGVLNETQFANYNILVSGCLSTGAHCLIDIHNYGRFNGQASDRASIIGQGGPSDEIFAELWFNIAKHWKNEAKVMFGIMNEPHDLNITTWALTVQAAVSAIRNAGANTQMILLPGTNYTSATYFVSSGSADALASVRNPDGTFTNLIMDVHKYLDVDASASHLECVSNGIKDTWHPLSTWLHAKGRQALNTETGGGNVDSCVRYQSHQIAYFAKESDVILGYVGWAAGSFSTDYIMSQVPLYRDNSWSDTKLVSMVMSPHINSLIFTPNVE